MSYLDDSINARVDKRLVVRKTSIAGPTDVSWRLLRLPVHQPRPQHLMGDHQLVGNLQQLQQLDCQDDFFLHRPSLGLRNWLQPATSLLNTVGLSFTCPLSAVLQVASPLSNGLLQKNVLQAACPFLSPNCERRI